jgi:hypothetical protein
MVSNIICFLTVRPCSLFYDFCKKLKNNVTDVYICIDDNKYEIPNYDGYLNIIKLDNKICEESGYKSTVYKFNNKACSRDKALYYFCKNNINYDYLWFIEEDVFIPDVNTIEYINNKYKDGDLLSAANGVIYEKRTDWHWNHINRQIQIQPPYSFSMICAIRVSKKLMNCIEEYANKYKNLFMDEALFNTLAVQSHLNIITPIELSSIVFKRNWKKDEIQNTYLYHPIKDIKLQYKYREP